MSWPDSGPPLADEVARLARDVGRGLTARPRWLPPKYFYDAAGAELFDRITALPEYYLTRAEQAILAEVGAAIVRRLEPREIVELGPGACHKVRPLLDAVDHGGAVRYVPFDVEGAALARALERLARDYPALDVRTVVGDFEHDLDRLPSPAGRRLVLFLGSTIGNFDPPDCRRLLGALGRCLGPGGRLLLGVDLVKDRGVLEAAYNDAASRIEMHLVAVATQRVCLKRLGLTLDFEAGESIWTESSYKYTRASVAAMLSAASLAGEGWFTDRDGRFALVLARAEPPLSAPGAREF